MSVNLSIKDVPDDVAERLRERAQRNHRSLQGELRAIIEAAARPVGRRSVSDLLAEIRASGLETAGDSVEIIRAARDAR